MGLLDQCIEWIGHESMMINGIPCAYVPHSDSRRTQRTEYGFRNGLVLAAQVIQVEKAHLCPVEGEQQGNHRLGDLCIRRTCSSKGREIHFVGGIAMCAVLQGEVRVRVIPSL